MSGFHSVGQKPDGKTHHHYQVHSEHTEEFSSLTPFEHKTSDASSRSFKGYSSEVERSNKPQLPERKSKHLNIQETSQSQKPTSLEQVYLDKINELMSAPQDDVAFHAKLQYHINKYEDALKGWAWVSHVALSFINGTSTPALRAIKYNSTIDKTSPDFKTLLESLNNPDKEYGVISLGFSIEGKVGSYSGNIKNGLPNQKEEGSFTGKDGLSFTGGFKNGLPHGKVIMSAPDGTFYEGPFKKGKPHGKGVLTNPNGSTYEGEFVEGKPHGKGKLTNLNGSTYEGKFIEGKKHGAGKFTYKNGSVFEGEYYKGDFLKGKLTLSNGVIYEGNFEKGKFEGQGKLTLKDGTVIEGTFKNGEIDFAEMKNLSGDVYKGPFKDGKPDTSHEFGVKGILKKGEAVYEGKFNKGRFVSGTIQVEDRTYRGTLDKEGNFIGTVMNKNERPKAVKSGVKVSFQESFNIQKTTLSDFSQKSQMIKKTNEMMDDN